MQLVKALDLDKVTSFYKEDLPEGIPITEVCQGLKTWRCPSNGFFIGRLHCSADPKKRTLEWKEEARKGMTWAQWMREYEIVWSSFEGIPVFGDDYNRHFHVSSEPLHWAKEYPIVRGWDFGLSAGGMACVFAQLVSNFRLFIYKELIASDTDIEHFAPAVKQQSLEWFPGCFRYFDIVDPTGFNRSQQDKRSCVDIVKEVLHAKPVPGEKTWIKRRKAVSDFLRNNPKGIPGMLIDPGCQILCEGFDGGYHYAYKKDGQVDDLPAKNFHSHVHDALQMICSRIQYLDLNSQGPVQLGGPAYGFGR